MIQQSNALTEMYYATRLTAYAGVAEAFSLCKALLRSLLHDRSDQLRSTPASPAYTTFASVNRVFMMNYMRYDSES